MSDPHATLDYALGLLERGLSIIPVNTSGPRAKKPHFHALHGTGHSYQERRGERMVNIPSWKEFQDVRATPDEVMTWVHGYAVDGFAVVTGALSGLVGIDFDMDGMATLAALGWEPHVRTPSGGAHLYVRHPGYRVKTVKASGIKDPALRLPAGVDVRGDGGYILLPPARIHGKGQYVRTAVRGFLSVESIPEVFMDGTRPCALRRVLGFSPLERPDVTPVLVPAPLFTRPERDRQRVPVEPLLRRAADLAAAGKGRNEAGFWFACQMRDNEYSEHECLSCFPSLVGAFPPCDTKGEISPYREAEFLDSVRSAYRGRRRQVWSAPQRSGRLTY